ncbi:MAG: [FeFe] hydrogenase H-cluster radical SAM maturase HydE [Clostridia bacterium]|nr:[FeFe] hydrogenase H-cluster radical SAM maturase HydE [Clostridia bacterium]
MTELAIKLLKEKKLSQNEYKTLISTYTAEDADALAKEACRIRDEVYGKKVFIRGLIEISNICRNDCFYCGIRKSNAHCVRYRLTHEEILECCEEGYNLGFRTFVLQGGEDGYYTDKVLCGILAEIKSRFPECAVTLSLGERTYESYLALFNAGADRYLLRHETADAEHYSRLHPQNLTLENRMRCLEDLRDIGYQVGAGFMVGSPYQTVDHIAKDLCFIQDFKPDMCGIGPFIPHKDTPFGDFSGGSANLTCFLLSVIRIIHPCVLLPATTALGTVSEDGREKGILSGANVVMPNLSPASVRKKYQLYNNKLSDGAESAQCLQQLKERVALTGCEITVDRGDVKKG